MKIIPFIYLKNRKILDGKAGNYLSLNELLERVSENEEIYFLDLDGIQKDKPNLCTYQRMSENRKIWVDAGPRVLGDVVDIVMAGATNITLRKELWPELDISGIREITENNIYIDIDIKSQAEHNINVSLFHAVDGLVVFNDKDEIDGDFKSVSFLKNLCIKYNIYAYESNTKNFSFWKTLGASGLLVDLNKKKESKKNEF